MGASQPKAQTQIQPVIQVSQEKLAQSFQMANTEAQIVQQQDKHDSDMITIQGKTMQNQEGQSPLRNLYKMRQSQNNYDDWIDKVAAQTQAKQEAKAEQKKSEQAAIGPFKQNKVETVQQDVEPLRFEKDDKMKKAMSETMKKKIELQFNRRLEKGHERVRARTPDSVQAKVYDNVLQGPLLVDYLKAQHFFKDEMDEEPEDQNQYFAGLKFADDQVSPLKWDSNTVVVDVFRVLQDITTYTYDFNPIGDVGSFGQLAGENLNPGAGDQKDIQIPIALQGNKLISDKQTNNSNFVGTLSGQGGKEMYNTQMLYDKNLNKNLQEPSKIVAPKSGKSILTMRVEFKRNMTTAISYVIITFEFRYLCKINEIFQIRKQYSVYRFAILKIPSGNYFDKDTQNIYQ